MKTTVTIDWARLWHWLNIALSMGLVAFLTWTALTKALPQWQVFANGLVVCFIAEAAILRLVRRT